MDVLLNNLPTLLGVLLGVGVIWKYVSKIIVILLEVKELLDVLLAALSDKKLTKEEVDQIVKEARDIPEALKNIFKSKED